MTATGGEDGYVSLEVSPHLAHDTEKTVSEAKRLRAAVDRPNLMVKVPATPAGIPAIERLIADGVNVNVTLMFSMSHYEAVARAYVNGLERCADPSRRSRRWPHSLSAESIRWWTRRWKRYRHAPTRRALMGKDRHRQFQRSSTAASRKSFTARGSSALRRRGARVQRPLLGQHGNEESRLLRRSLRRESDRPRNRQHPAAGYDQRVSRARHDSRRDGERRLCRRRRRAGALGESRHRSRRGHREAARGRSRVVRGVLRPADGGARQEAQGDRRRGRSIGFELHLGKIPASASSGGSKSGKTRNSPPGCGSGITRSGLKEPQPELTDRLGWLELPVTMEKQVAGLSAFADKAKADGIDACRLFSAWAVRAWRRKCFQKTFGNPPGYPELHSPRQHPPDGGKSD
jgi:hypothetical protein